MSVMRYTIDRVIQDRRLGWGTLLARQGNRVSHSRKSEAFPSCERRDGSLVAREDSGRKTRRYTGDGYRKEGADGHGRHMMPGGLSVFHEKEKSEVTAGNVTKKTWPEYCKGALHQRLSAAVKAGVDVREARNKAAAGTITYVEASDACTRCREAGQ